MTKVEEWESKSQALQGLKVADFSWIAVGPIICMWFAHHGAQVIRIESMTHPDSFRAVPPFKDGVPGINRSGQFANYNTNKYGLALNLNHPKGVEVARQIIAWADVLVESFTPGTMKKWGLDYENIRKIRPDIIMLSTSMQGQTGPAARSVGFGTGLTNLVGFTNPTGWPDRGPTQLAGAYTDFLAPPIGIASILAALETRRKTNRGQWIDLSQFESSVHFLAPVLLDYIANGREVGRKGNCHSWAVPHGAYRCLGDDRWCVISVFTDEEWTTLCRVIGQQALASDPELGSVLNRKKREEEINGLIEEWTSNRTAEEVVTQLQANGIAAGIVENAKDLLKDPQLKHRGYFVPLNHPEMGQYKAESPAWKLSETPSQVHLSGPCYGEHTEYVCTQILGMSDERFLELFNEDVFT